MSENDLLGIVKKPAFEVVIAREIETTSENGQSLFDILPMWEEFNWSDDYFLLTELASDGRVPVIGAKNMGIVVFKAGTPKFTLLNRGGKGGNKKSSRLQNHAHTGCNLGCVLC